MSPAAIACNLLSVDAQGERVQRPRSDACLSAAPRLIGVCPPPKATVLVRAQQVLGVLVCHFACGAFPGPRAQSAAQLGDRVRQDEWQITLHRTVIPCVVGHWTRRRERIDTLRTPSVPRGQRPSRPAGLTCGEIQLHGRPGFPCCPEVRAASLRWPTLKASLGGDLQAAQKQILEAKAELALCRRSLAWILAVGTQHMHAGH